MKFHSVILFLISFLATAQDKLEFVYVQKSNYLLKDEGVYADTLLLQLDFPDLKYSTVRYPETDINVGFIAWNELTEKNINDLYSILYHTHQVWECTYYPKRDKTYIKIIRDDADLAAAATKYFNRKYRNSVYKLQIRYKNGRVINPASEYTGFKSDVSSPAAITYFNEAKTEGRYTRIYKGAELYDRVELDPKLNKKIVPGQLFINNDFGIKRIISVPHTLTLQSWKTLP